MRSDDLKDSRLERLARDHNVAAFVSFGPDGDLRHHAFSSSAGRELNRRTALEAVFQSSRSGTINVRTFDAAISKGMPFHYGLTSLDEVETLLDGLAKSRLYSICNETIDVMDGGVSGVSLGGIVEFAPDATPRVVEEPGTAQMLVDEAQSILGTVYGFDPKLPSEAGRRFEFSVHPYRCGTKSERVIVWEAEDVPVMDLKASNVWPNRFSAHIGDKTYGLLTAYLHGAKVPFTRVVGRRVAPFEFGQRTGTAEWWLRTAPKTQTPGHFTTTSRWTDPFELLQSEDSNRDIAAVLAQEAVEPIASGATQWREGADVVEGVYGQGDNFMLGTQAPDQLDKRIVEQVRAATDTLQSRLGPVRVEWVHDGTHVWVVQLHRAHSSDSSQISPGTATEWVDFQPADGLGTLRNLINDALQNHFGVRIVGPVGVTSHVGDLLRQAGVPGRVEY